MNKQYLNKGYGIKKEIEILNSVIEEIRTNLDGVKGISYSGIKVQGGPVKDEGPLLEKIAEIEKIQERLLEKRRELVLFQGELLEKVNKIEDRKTRSVLYLRYILNLTWEEISVRMGYSDSYVKRINKNYLKREN